MIQVDPITAAQMARADWIASAQAMPYSAYLKTSWWSFVHERTLKRSRGYCELCHGTATEAHHTTYEHIGCEHPDDMVALCRDCHQHITDNGMDRIPRRDLLRRRAEILHSPEFGRTWGRL